MVSKNKPLKIANHNNLMFLSLVNSAKLSMHVIFLHLFNIPQQFNIAIPVFIISASKIQIPIL